MWTLKHPSRKQLREYRNILLPGLVKRICKSNDADIIEELIPAGEEANDAYPTLTKLLFNKPTELLTLHNELMAKIMCRKGYKNPPYAENELIEYQSAKRKRNRNGAEIKVFNKYDSVLSELLDTFDYQSAISGDKDVSYRITEMKDTNTCTYCNRQYTINVVRGKEKIARPQLDHWYAKELYPLMSLSFFNLIPSCSVCNSSVKRSDLFSLQTHVHPYLAISEPKFKFRLANPYATVKPWTIELDNLSDAKEQKMVEDLCLLDQYKVHETFEVRDILNFQLGNSPQYLNDLLRTLKDDTGLREEDIFRMVFGTELNEEHSSKRPLSKLKRDILEQLGVKF